MSCFSGRIRRRGSGSDWLPEGGEMFVIEFNLVFGMIQVCGLGRRGNHNLLLIPQNSAYDLLHQVLTIVKNDAGNELHLEENA